MPDLLLELFSEEIPARMQRRAAADLERLVGDGLIAAGLTFEGAKAHATPRRLALHVVGLPAQSPDQIEERRGPRVGAPEAAIQGFLRGAGLASLDQARRVDDPKKGEFWVARLTRPGRPTPEILAGLLPEVVRDFPWPKSMRWGARSAPEGTAYSPPDARGTASLRWVRPLHGILCTFGPETSETEVVDFEVDGIRSGRTTRGHRFLAPGAIEVRRFDDYVEKLERAFVVLDADRRKAMILADARDRALAGGLELIEDEALLEEVAGLVEWPVVLMGAFDESFLAVPSAIIQATIRANQKCFVLRGMGMAEEGTREERGSHPPERGRGPAPQAPGGNHLASDNEEPHPDLASRDRPSPGRGGMRPAQREGAGLAPRFILVSNLVAADGGAAIVAGNERVVRARLADAKFFFEQDLKTRLEDRLEKFKQITFHDKLGTQWERIERISRLAREIAPLLLPRASPAEREELAAKAERAARLAKADLLTEAVGEFPELQGHMGRIYALAQGEPEDIAAACEDHYKPLGPTDRVPADPVSVAVALADKLDTLVGFWAIDEKPTGSKDPYALRRAALGVIRIVLEQTLKLNIGTLINSAYRLLIHTIWRRDRLLSENHGSFDYVPLKEYKDGVITNNSEPVIMDAYRYAEFLGNDDRFYTVLQTLDSDTRWFITELNWFGSLAHLRTDLLAFFADRLKVQLRAEGARHDLVDAVFALGNQDDLVLIVRRVEALGRFLDTAEGQNLLAAYRRAANILRVEEKRDGRAYDGPPDRRLVEERGLPQERALLGVLDAATRHARDHVLAEEFEAAMAALSEVRPAVDAFFDHVTVNTDNPALRENRLKLLNAFREACHAVADFSRIAG